MRRFRFTVISKKSKSILDAVVIDVEAEKLSLCGICDLGKSYPYDEEWFGKVIHEEFTGLEINILLLKHYLSTAFVMYGHRFDPEHYTPRLLHEALSGSDSKYTILNVDGYNPKHDIPHYNDDPLAGVLPSYVFRSY